MNVYSAKHCAKYFIPIISAKTNLKNPFNKYSYYTHITDEGTGAWKKAKQLA